MGKQVLQLSLITVRTFYHPGTGQTSSEFVLLKNKKGELAPDDNLSLNPRDLV